MTTRMLEVRLRPLVDLHVRFNGEQRGKGSIAFGARERLGVAVFVARQLDVRLERLRAKRTLKGTNIRMREQVMVVDGRCFVPRICEYKHS